MKKKNKVLATSVATIALCASLVAGGTYALFTSESEVNIAVTSGTVDVRATAGALTLYSNNEKQTGNAFANGGTATKVENEISIDRMTPMDSVNFDVKIENYSDVKVQYRTVIKAVDDTGLFEALDVTFTENNESQTFAGGIAYADWATLDAGDNNPNTPEDVSTINVNIEFPNGDNQNVYQGKSCKLAVVVEAVQANADVVNPITYENGIYYVNSEEGMMLMKGIIDSNPHGEGRELNFKLTANMDMTGYDWNVPNAGFTNIDGDNYTVSNLVCGQTERGWSGFLGYFGGGTLKNITLENVTAIGSQAGVIAGHADGGCIENVTIKGANTVAYEENAVETWGGVGALLGVSTGGLKASSNITVASGATISVAYNDILTESAYANEYAFIQDISAYVTNNGMISTTGTWGIYLADGLYQMADGTYKITNANGLVTAGASYFSKGGTFNLVNSVTLSDELWIPAKVGKNFTFNGNGNTISNLNVADPAGSTNGMGAYSFLLCADGVADDTTTVKNVIFDGAKITGNGADNANMAVVLTTTRQHDYSTLVMENVTVQNSVLKNGDRTGGLLAYGDSKATITMTNCASNNNTIESKGTAGALIAFTNFATTTINGFEAKNNTISSSEGAGKAGIVIGTASGATTVTVNDLDEAIAGSKAINAGEETNNVAGRMANTDTIKSTMTINGADYVIVADDTALSGALSSGSSNVSVALGEGDYTMPLPQLQGKTLTISGTKDTVIDVTNVDENNQFVTGANITFEGVTLEFGTAFYKGFANTESLTYKNCTIKGLQFLYGGSATFENCVFDSNGAEHCVWTYGVKKVDFIDCDFTYGDRCVNVYTVGEDSVVVNFTDCKFNYTKTKNDSAFGAVEINDRSYKTSVNVTMTGCTAPADGEMVYLSRWRSAGDVIATVVVNGTAITIPQEPNA